MKACPYCAEQIQDAAIKCRYCGSMLTDAPPPTGSTAAGSVLEREVQTLVAQRQLIAAIKLVRVRTHAGLRDAKTYVEAVATGAHPPLPVAGAAPEPGAFGRSVAVALKWIVALAGLLAIWWIVERRGH